MGDFMGRIMTNMQLVGHLINGYMPSCPHQVTDMFRIVHSMGCAWKA